MRRQCWECKAKADYESDILPGCKCVCCGAEDTRLITYNSSQVKDAYREGFIDAFRVLQMEMESRSGDIVDDNFLGNSDVTDLFLKFEKRK